MTSNAGRSAPTAPSPHSDDWGMLLSGAGVGLILTVIPIALCDYVGHGIFIADKRLELLIIGMLLGVCGGAVRHHKQTNRRRTQQDVGAPT